jgi:creatinine amidohydrolase/Fe(II)-dependent formamide hydrolase-like protein
MNDKELWRYDRLTWPEIKQAVDRQPQPVVAIPFGAVEDHGPHLPISTDNDILEAILHEVAKRGKGDLLVTPTIPSMVSTTSSLSMDTGQTTPLRTLRHGNACWKPG